MASVAICPHCYLQLIVPDGVEPDERVECPTCAKEFGVDQAVQRPIPEIVRRPRATERIERAETAAETKDVVAAVIPDIVPDEIEIEVEERVEEFVRELAVDASDADEADVLGEIESRIEAELAAGGLHPVDETALLHELPSDDVLEESAIADDFLELASTAEANPQDDLTSWFRHAKTVPDLPPLAAAEADEITDVAAEVEEPATLPIESFEPPSARPTVRTLADMLPPAKAVEEVAEIDELELTPGPSFDLPNVPLTPQNGATIEIDPSMSFGPAAETEFELDDVDFEAMPADELLDEESEESYEANEADEAAEPVFSEPEDRATSAAPFVLPAIPRARKKRSVVRMLAGTVVGGAIGLALGYVILLYVLGPSGDMLHIAEYLPSAVLPKSFQKAPARIAKVEPPTESTPAESDATPAAETTAPADEATVAETTDDEKSTNVPADYEEEAKKPAEIAATHEAPADNRYGTEPSPLEEPAAEPIAEEKSHTAAAPLPLHGPTITIEQLDTALEAGKQAESGLVTGSLSDASVRRTKGASYETLSALAEALTFVDRTSPSAEVETASESADRLFREVLSDEHTRNEVAKIVSIWIDSPHRKNSGIFLAGTVSGGQIEGDVYEYSLTTDDGGKLVLLMHEPIDPLVEGSAHPVGIVGSIVDNPAESVSGYSGTAKRAIWGARTIPLN